MKTLAQTMLLATTLFSSASLLWAQTGAATIAPPNVGLILNYQFWPMQYVQWFGAGSPYSMIELLVNQEAKTPVYKLTLTGKDGETRVSYTNDDRVLAQARTLSEEAHKTAIAFEGGDTTNTGSVSTVRLTLADGKPLQWRFVQGSDVSEQGSGLTPLPTIPVPVFAYREQGAVAGEGTAVEIGNVVSAAEVWKEISRPPYFVGYRGAYTVNAHRLVFGAGKESWKTVSAPAALAAGAVWELEGAGGVKRTLKVEKVDGARYTIASTEGGADGTRLVMDAVREGDQWRVERVRYVAGKNGEKHPFTVVLAGGKVEVIAGKKTVLASATEVVTDGTAVVSFVTPAWAKGKDMSEISATTGEEISVAARPVH